MEPTAKPKSPFKPKRTQADRLIDLRIIAQLAVRGYTMAEITLDLNSRRPYTLSRAQVYNDFHVLEEEWSKRANQSFAKLKNQELAKLDAVEAEAWTCWEASKAQGNDKAEARFLAVILNVSDRRQKLLGIAAPQTVKTEITGPAGGAIPVAVQEVAPALTAERKKELIAKYASVTAALPALAPTSESQADAEA
ncbi:MAG: hypothetical protein SFV32_12605 [Opitutaceae bacterium]|nr:hypothetical protein [Opitutaceae bacterium]